MLGLKLVGPLTVKEVERVIFRTVSSHPQFEVNYRTWLEEDHSYFVRKRGDPPLILGLIQVFSLPEMAAELEFTPFDPEGESFVQEDFDGYAQLLESELEPEGFGGIMKISAPAG